LKISKDYKFFIKVAFVVLVVSILLPYAIEPMGLHVFYNPSPTWPSGVPTSQTYKTWTFRWSFLNVRITTTWRNTHPYDADFVGTQWVFLIEYWTIYPQATSTLLGTIFALQVILIPLYLFTLKKATTPRNVIPLFLGVTTLLILYFGILQRFSGVPSFGFWLTIVAILFTLIPFVKRRSESRSLINPPVQPACELSEILVQDN